VRFSQSAKAATKATVRRALWKVGYDIVPLASGFVDVQRALFQRADLLLDVGANTGQFAERARALGYHGRLISYEPSAEAYRVLARRASGDPSWQTEQLALGAREGTATLNVSGNSVSSSLLPIGDRHVRAAPPSAPVRAELVPLSTLDAALSEVTFQAALLKLDVQGYEADVVAGAGQTLSRVCAVQCELSVVPLYEGQTDYLDLMATFRKLGLHLVHVEPGFQDPDTGAVLQLEALFSRPQL
jgi:FkbM family methyltransferase